MKACAFAVALLTMFVPVSAGASGFGDFNAGLAWRNRSDPAQAIRFLTLAIGERDLPANLLPVAYVVRGRAYDMQENYDAAIADYTAALALRNDYADAYLERAATYVLKGQLPQAITDCNSAIALDPDNWRLHKLRIDLYRGSKRYDDALADLAPFIARRPGNIELQLGRAEILRAAGRYPEAIAAAKAARDSVPQWMAGVADAFLSTIYLDSGDLNGALASISAASKAFPKIGLLTSTKGQIEWALGRFDDAEDSFDDSMDNDESEQKYNFLWLVIARARNRDNIKTHWASRMASQDLTRWPGRLVALYLGAVKPEDVLQDNAGNDKDHCATNFFVGEWYLINGNPAEARHLLQSASTACADNWKIHRFAAIDLARLP